MLSNPNVNDMIPKVGSRYEVAIAVAKRARNIANERLVRGDSSIKDPVDIATKEIFNEKLYVKKSGKYILNVDEYEVEMKAAKLIEEKKAKQLENQSVFTQEIEQELAKSESESEKIDDENVETEEVDEISVVDEKNQFENNGSKDEYGNEENE